MPTNVTPEYRKAEQAFRQAREPRERLECLREMLRTIPKHKGTEHVQADIKTRIKQLTEQIAGPKKGGGRSAPSYSVPPAGAAQVALIGPPNSGKSSLHVKLTGSHAEIAPGPFTTQVPMPGMLPHKDIQFQLIDLPPISAQFIEPWFPNALARAEAALLIVDVNDAACVEHVQIIRERLAEKKIALDEQWPGLNDGTEQPATDKRHKSWERAAEEEDDELKDPFRIELPTLLVANKCDLDPEPDEVKVLEELLGVQFPALSTSAATGQGLDRIGSLLFEGLQVVRVYTKAPNRPPEMDRPFTVRPGQTVLDMARLVHKDIAAGFRFARIWGSGVFDGQQVGPDHEVADGDIVELHTQ
ncbi:MAG: TGS domain-containing protein [Phycisphaerales bacterium]|nr:MAG: TGS domain-containing protein [Phycisphaerales bacterium]